MDMRSNRITPKPKSNSVDVGKVFQLASEGFGEATIAGTLGMSLATFRIAMSDRPEVREAFDEGSQLALEAFEHKVLTIMNSPSASNRDITQAFATWSRNNRQLIKRNIKSKAEGVSELTVPELRARLAELKSQIQSEDVDPLQQRLNTE